MEIKPIVTVIRPNLTPEERAEKIERVKQCMIEFWIAKMRMDKEKEK